MRPQFLAMICSSLLIFSGSSSLFSTTVHAAQSNLISIAPSETYTLLQKNQAVLVDVREWDEIQSGMAKPALWMPLSRMKDGDRMFEIFLKSLPKEKLIVFYCAAGRRAQKAEIEMKKRGYRTANLGGFSEWLKSGLPTKIPEQRWIETTH